MNKLLSCEFTMDTACVELKYEDGTMISIDYIAVEGEVARNMYERLELDYLVYNDPAAYAALTLNGHGKDSLRRVTEYRPGTPHSQRSTHSPALQERRHIGRAFAPAGTSTLHL